MKGREENLFLKLLLLVVVLFLLLLQLCGGAQVPQLKCGDQKTPSGVVPLLPLWDPGIKFRSFVASHRPRRTILDVTQLTLLAQNLFLGDDLAIEPQRRRGGLCSLEKEGQSEVFYTDCLLPCLGWHTSFFFFL